MQSLSIIVIVSRFVNERQSGRMMRVITGIWGRGGASATLTALTWTIRILVVIDR